MVSYQLLLKTLGKFWANKLKRILKEIRMLLFRNKHILKETNTLCTPKRVNLHWCSNYGVPNIGDELSPFIVEHMLKIKGISKDVQVKKTKHLFAIGSIISFGYQNSTIWGSGLIREGIRSWKLWKFFRKMDIRAVRGPRTREVLTRLGYSCPDTYGDPAVLLPLIIPDERTEKKYDYIIIRHYGDHREISIKDDIHYLDLDIKTKDFKKFVSLLTSGKKVISSSLHGIILAESYGIPAIMLNRQGLNHFKFKDWYESTNRYCFPIANSIEEAMNMESAGLPDLTEMREKLINAFPYDLYS